MFDVLIDLHVSLAAAGWIAGDLYDGCLMFDFELGSLAVVDLDTYRRGRIVNDMGRMFGSSRFMAPEEFERGALIDERTTTFALGRLVWHFGMRLTEIAHDFCGSPAVADVVRRPVRTHRQTDTPPLRRLGRRGWLPPPRVKRRRLAANMTHVAILTRPDQR